LRDGHDGAPAEVDVKSSRQASIYLPTEVLAELQSEADRQQRSLSWLLRQAWKLAAPQVRQLSAEPRR
jgi:uncharacterized small protein (TIGR04563 family)